MREFNIKKGNFIKSENSTSLMMNNILIVISSIAIFSFCKNGIFPFAKGTILFSDLIHLFLLLVLPMIICILTEFVWNILKNDKRTIRYVINRSYAYLPGIFLSLIASVNTPIWLIILASIMATIIGKMAFGGLGKNLLNPALVGGLLLIIFIKDYASPSEIINNGLTPLQNLQSLGFKGTYNQIVLPYGNLFNIMLGNVSGSLGGTSAILCLFGFAYLTITKTIKWRIPVYSTVTIFIVTTIIALTNNMGLWYPVFNLITGSFLFGVVFMATDPVTSPISKDGQRIYGVLLGIIALIIRFFTPFVELLVIPILIMNLLNKLINKISIMNHFNKSYYVLSAFSLIILVALTTLILNIKL